MSTQAKRIAVVGFSVIFSLVAAGCSSDVGSNAWCEKMKRKPKGDWSANEATNFAKHCIFK